MTVLKTPRSDNDPLAPAIGFYNACIIMSGVYAIGLIVAAVIVAVLI